MTELHVEWWALVTWYESSAEIGGWRLGAGWKYKVDTLCRVVRKYSSLFSPSPG